jgi:hypothetical protein
VTFFCAVAAALCVGPAPAAAHGERTVYLAGPMPDEALIAFTTAVAASPKPGVVLFDSPATTKTTRAFLEAFQPDQLVPVGTFSETVADLEVRFGQKPEAVHAWQRGPPADLECEFYPQARRVVVCPAQPRRQLLQAACLAGVLRVPLVVTAGKKDGPDLKRRLVAWRTQEILAVGDAADLCRSLTRASVVPLQDEESVQAEHVRHLRKQGQIQTFVVANPTDGKLAALAPWLALQRRAALLLTNDRGDNVRSVVQDALKQPDLRRADAVILLADLKAIPVEKRPNPVKGDYDRYIEMEPLTPRAGEPFSFAVGRLFHADRNVVALVLARQRLLAAQTATPKALIVSNPGGGLPLLETFSRNTDREFRNAGYDTTAQFGREVNPAVLRKLLPQQTIFLWEGHHGTLVREYGVPQWKEPLRPSLVFLQSCMALAEPKAHPFLERGAVAVIGTSTRMYSGSGGALALAFCDALLYDQSTVGGSLRQAKNFMVAFAQLKEQRLHEEAKLSGANLRAAWAFTLWGDPTLRLPRPAPPADALPAVRHQVVQGKTITVSLPAAHPLVKTSKYQATMPPNGRLAGLRTKETDDEEHHGLTPLVFVEVELPRAPAGNTPRLRSSLPGRNWTFLWDARLQRGYLLAVPRPADHDAGALRFQVAWN